MISFGVDVDVSEAKLDISAISTLLKNSISVGQDVKILAQTSGLTQLELDSLEPPLGSVTLQKADLHRLYKRLSALKTQSELLYQKSGIKVDVSEPEGEVLEPR
ncbi:hypothetical protein C1752_07896 [Acaryochloris thomasi RCC1774]|uniref:Uncharacterized protein n=1 Tax=Acaryochloris thomasi RCC1774 TaxID=1764569 RepID=A0A2W1JB32_9CYAN|nr:hypothetical protein [Acaryochloris thomasi]PZD71168.1 hypothetical protein C1752_07896 [Acaryochloris thomasi RCC1774]